jgi:hypothetical protein
LLGLSTGARCGFAGALCCLTLPGGNIVSTGRSCGVLFSTLCAFVKRLGCAAQRRCEAFGGLPRATCRAFREPPALGGIALTRGPLAAILRLFPSLALLEPRDLLVLSLRPLPVGALLTLIRQPLALVGEVFTVVGVPLSLIRNPFALVRDPVASIRRLLALRRQPLARVGHPLVQRGRSVLTTAMTLTTQPVALTLQDGIIGGQLRHPAPDLRAEPLDLGQRGFIARVERPGT